MEKAINYTEEISDDAGARD